MSFSPRAPIHPTARQARVCPRAGKANAGNLSRNPSHVGVQLFSASQEVSIIQNHQQLAGELVPHREERRICPGDGSTSPFAQGPVGRLRTSADMYSLHRRRERGGINTGVFSGGFGRRPRPITFPRRCRALPGGNADLHGEPRADQPKPMGLLWRSQCWAEANGTRILRAGNRLAATPGPAALER